MSENIEKHPSHTPRAQDDDFKYSFIYPTNRLNLHLQQYNTGKRWNQYVFVIFAR